MISLQLALLGGFQARSDKRMPLVIPVKKAKVLLAYLALYPGQWHSRDKLAALLWEDSNDAQARHSLRQALVCLRKAFPEPAQVIQTNDDGLTIPPQAVEVDVLEFERLVKADTSEALEQAMALYQGELLEGFNPGTSGFEDWLMERRSQLRECAIVAAQTLLVQQLADKPGERAIALALRLVSWDPLRESTQRTLMKLYAQSGRYGAALRQYQTCRAMLQRELGIEPELQTEALYEDLLKQRRTAATDHPLSVSRSREADLPSPPIVLSETSPKLKLSDVREAPELRQASILIARLTEDEDYASEPLDMEESHAAQQHLLARIHAACERFGGCLIQLSPEAVMVAFGIPQAHGNDAERAVRAALAIQQTDVDGNLSGHHGQARIGLASGPVLASQWREDDPHGYMVTGDVVQEADHWCLQAGSAEIMMSDTLYVSLRERLIAVALASEDTAHPPSAWRLQSFHDEPRFEQPTFIGRRMPLRQFTGALESCRETGCGQALLVRGDAGIGKSRLVEECAGLARIRGFSCYRVLILDFGVAIDQGPLQILVRDVLSLNANTPIDQFRTVVTRTIEEGIIEDTQAVFLNDLLGLPQPVDRHSEYDATRHEVRHQGRQAVIGQLIAATARRQPLLLIVEDIHWADAATLDVLARIAAVTRENPVILAMTSRLEGEPLEPAWRGAMQGASLLTLDLGPLRAEEAQELSQQFSALDADQAARCIERAGGNPLFLEQLLRAVQAGKPQIPHSVQSLVWARLDRLAPPDRAAVQSASIMGQRFTLDALRHVINDPDYRCDPLIEHRLVRRDGDHYLFAHALIQEGIYASLRKTRQRELHQRAARWFADRDRRLHAEHLDRAGDPAAAQAYLITAREQAAGHRLDQALQLTQRGRALASEASTAYALACLHGDLLRETGLIDESIAAFEQALTQAHTGIEQAQAWIGVADGLGVQDRYAQALDALDQAQHCAGTIENAGLLAQIHYQRGNVCFPMGRIDTCFREHERAFEYARATGSPTLEACALSGLGDAYYQRGRILTAHRYFEQCVTLCREHSLVGIEPANLTMLGLTRFYQNDWGNAERDGTTATEVAARMGNKRGEALALNILGTVFQYRACWTKALEAFEKSLNLVCALGAQRFEAENLGSLGFIYAQLGQQAQAERCLEQAWTLCCASGTAYVGAWLLSVWALVMDDASRRTELLKEGEALLETGSVSHNYLHFYQNAMEAVLMDRHWSEVERYAAALAAYTAAEPLPWSKFFIARGQALARHGRGERTPELAVALRALHAQGESVGLLVAVPALQAALDELKS